MDYLISILVCLLPVALADHHSVVWCYHGPTCNDTMWPTIASDYCNGSRQSPIDIVSASAVLDSSLGPFTFTGFDDKTAMSKIKNLGGRLVKVAFTTGRLHLHIVNAKSVHNGNLTAIVADSGGLAALGFFIEVDSGTTDQPASWKTLASHLANITEKGEYVSISGISMNDLISGVDTTSYYRYLGSLTTPNCNEAVVWTVFKDTVKVSKNLIDLFSTTVHIGNSSSLLMTNIYRNVQPLNGRQITTSTSSAKTSYATKSLLALGLAAPHPLLHLSWGTGGW